MNLAEVKQLNAGDEVNVKGILTKVFDRKTGFSKKGHKPWSIQNGTVSDESGEIRISVWNHADLQPLTHCEVEISGAEAEDNEWENKVTRQIKIEEAGFIGTISIAQQPSRAPSTAAEVYSGDARSNLEKLAGQIRQAHELAYREARKEREHIKTEHGDELTPELFQTTVSSIFINLCQRANGLIAKL